MNYEVTIDALANPTRRAILGRLRGGACSAGEIGSTLTVTQPAVSQHLKVLRQAGIVRQERAGTRRIYRVDPAGLAGLYDWLGEFWDDALKSYKEAMEADDRN
jgi:DNA-binding transcriptional ArsR family regulator